MRPSPDGQPEGGSWTRQARGLGVTWLVQSVTGLTMAMFGPLAPFLQDELNLSRAEVGLLASALFFTSFVLLIPIGSTVDKIGERWGMIIGQSVIGLMMALASLAPSYAALIGLVTLAGIGTNFTLPSTTRAIVIWFAARTRATAMGIKQTGFNAGGLVAAIALPMVAIVGGFRPALLVVGGYALVMAIISLLAYPTRQGQPPATAGIPIRQTLAFLTSADVLLAALVAATFNLVQSSLITYIVLYLNSVVLLPILLAGFYLALIQVSGAAGRIGWGLVSDRLLAGRRLEVLGFMAVGVIVLSAVIATLSPETPPAILAAVMVLTGVVFLGWAGVYLTIAGEIGGLSLAAGSTGVVATIANVGILIGPPTFGFLVDLTDAYTVAWGFLAASTAVGLAAVLILRRRGHIDHA